MSNSLWPHGLQHTSCLSPTSEACSNSCPLSRWCHPTISSSVTPFSCPQSFSASGSFLISQLLASSGQSIGVSASASVLSMTIQDWFPLGWTGLIPPIQWVIKSCWFTSCFYKTSVSSSFPVLTPCFRVLLSLSLINKTAFKLVFLLRALSSQNSCSKRSCILYS